MNAIYKSLLVATALVATITSNQVEAGCLTKCCPKCDHVCKFEAKMGETEKSCFEVETKHICIPRVVFPWQQKSKSSGSCSSCDACSGKRGGCAKCSCVNNGATVREVRVLKSKKYKCPECKYTWTAEKKGCGSCGGNCSGGCATAGYAADYNDDSPASKHQTTEYTPAPAPHAPTQEHSDTNVLPAPQPAADQNWAPVQVESIPPAPTRE